MTRQFRRISTLQQSRRRKWTGALKEKSLVLESNCWRLTDEHQLAMLNTDEVRLRNREQLIENLERVIQEKNASINKLEERSVSSADLSNLLNKRLEFSSDQVLNETLHQRNVEFHLLEERLKQYEEKVIVTRRHLSCFFVFSCNVTKIILDMYIRTIASIASANLWKDDTRLSTWEWTCVSQVLDVCSLSRSIVGLYEHVSDLTNELREKTSHDFINKEKILVGCSTFFHSQMIARCFSLDVRSDCGGYSTLARETRFVQSDHRAAWRDHI